MNILFYRIFFFCLVPAGIFILVKGIQLISKAFNGVLLLALPFTQKSGAFKVVQTGNHAIWQRGQLRRRTPVDEFRPQIVDLRNGDILPLNKSVFTARSNDFSTGRMEMFSFYATKGKYELQLVPGSSVSGLQKVLGKVVPLKMVDPEKYFIEIRESQSQFLTMLGIPMILLGVFTTIGGLVVGILAHKIFA